MGLQTNNTDLREILSEINNLPNAGGSSEQATPVISIDNSNGLITATAGTKTATKQLTTQAAKTITPSTSSQTAVVSGVYTTGAVIVEKIPATYMKPDSIKPAATHTPTTSDYIAVTAKTYCMGAQTVKGDANLVAENIKSGVSIFGVNGSYEGSGSGSGGTEIGKFVIGDLSVGAAELYTAAEFPFVVGQTWQDWIDSPCNITTYCSSTGFQKLVNSNGTITFIMGSGMTAKLSVDGSASGLVNINDLIQNDAVYRGYISGGF